MTTLFAIDPSTVASGVARFDGTRLVEVYVIEARGLDAMLDAIARYIGPEHAGYACVVETPVIYPHSRVDGNDLIQIAQVAGAFRARFHTSSHITPRGWNGGRPKKVTEARIRSLLLPDEVAKLGAVRVAVRHNAFDAVGVGMHHLKMLLR